MNIFYFVMQSTMFFTIPLLIVALGGLFSEKSGVVNIALEGKMLMGAFSGILFITTFQDRIPSQPVLILGLIVAMVTGIVVSLALAYAAITLKANQIIAGVAITMFAGAFVVYGARIIVGSQNIHFINQFRIAYVPFLGGIPFIGPMFFQGTFITTFMGFAILIIATFVLYKTKFGLRLRACGEHPHAADSVGISVTKMRYAGVIISGALAGMGGVVFIIPISILFDGTVGGYGFLALAVLIFGGWQPIKILLAALFFGLTQAIAHSHSAIVFLYNLNIPSQFYEMAPYIATLIALAFTSKNTMAPKALGQPFDQGGR